MKLPTLFFIVFVQGLATVAMAQEASEPIPLFDGQSLKGWEGNTSVFRVQDGAIVGGSLDKRIPRNEFLCTTRDYGDFELRLKFKLVGKSPNAGVQVRSRRVPNHHEVAGYQADMGQMFWGCLYDESRRNKVLAEPKDKKELMKKIRRDDWNDYRIRCEGRRIRLWLNDVLTVDYTEPDESIEQRGLIGVQIHAGAPSEAWYKDVTIEELGAR